MAAKFKAYVPQGTPVLDGATPVYLKREFSGISDALKSMQKSLSGGFLVPANNLSDVANAGTARTNLGLGAAATQPLSAFLQPSNNLSDLANKGTALANLSLSGDDPHGDANVTLTSAAIPMCRLTSHLSAARTWLLPLSTAVPNGSRLTFCDGIGSGAFTLTLSVQAGDVMIGTSATGVSANSINVTSSFQCITFQSAPGIWFVLSKT